MINGDSEFTNSKKGLRPLPLRGERNNMNAVANFINKHSSVKCANSKEKVQNMLLELMDDIVDENGMVSLEKISQLDDFYIGSRIQKIYGIIELELVPKH